MPGVFRQTDASDFGLWNGWFATTIRLISSAWQSLIRPARVNRCTGGHVFRIWLSLPPTTLKGLPQMMQRRS